MFVILIGLKKIFSVQAIVFSDTGKLAPVKTSLQVTRPIIKGFRYQRIITGRKASAINVIAFILKSIT